jgi:hypothetical protein
MDLDPTLEPNPGVFIDPDPAKNQTQWVLRVFYKVWFLGVK